MSFHLRYVYGCISLAGLYLSNFIRGVEVLAIEVDDRANA